MPRRSRVDFPGAFHHVCTRGIEKRNIFQDDRDRKELLQRIRSNLNRFGASNLAWALLPNHFHLLFHSNSGALRQFMHCLLTGYSLYFNRRHERVGHLFQNRYSSSPVESYSHLLELIRYIHLNPVRAGVIASLEELNRYEWTSHREIAATGIFPWAEFPMIMDCLGPDSGTFGEEPVSTVRYRDFLRDGLRIGQIRDFPDGFSDSSGNISSNHCLETGPEYRDPLFSESVKSACEHMGISRNALFGRSRTRRISKARRQVLADCVMAKGLDLRKVADWLGISEKGARYLMKGCPPNDAALPRIGDAQETRYVADPEG